MKPTRKLLYLRWRVVLFFPVVALCSTVWSAAPESLRGAIDLHCHSGPDALARSVPPDGLRDFISALREAGITSEEIDLMVRRNPATVLGLAN